ncbi:MAG: hypothetical protein SGJ27_14740 [Candidatus Melainabacteria bacterium]|nr:hypothetical protein [Candidatus Melainabacteria bacterium]
MRQDFNLTAVVFSRYKPLMATMAAVGLLTIAPASAANPAAPSPAGGAASLDPFRDLKGLERRFFFHEYDHEPLEKRLERIELLVFGAAQDGKNTDRLGRIRSAVVARDKEAAHNLAQKNNAAKPQESSPKPKATSPTSSSQYPILQTLEWRALQKTYSEESLDQRLDRLETSLLGQPSRAMSYSDRIDRLKKMIGVESIAAPKISPIPQGPTPRALGRRQISPFHSPYLTPLPRDDGDEDTTFEEDFQQQMNTDLRTMIEMMQRMNRAPGLRSPGMQLPNGGRGLILPVPNGEGWSPYIVPNAPAQPKKPKVPPYADPNSI